MNEEIVKLVQAAQQGDKKATKIIQNIFQKAQQGDQEAIQIATAIQELLKQKAAHGTKLQYFKLLKHKCADDEEVYYYKAGGSVGCGCRKIEKGRSGIETPETPENQRKKTVVTTPSRTTVEAKKVTPNKPIQNTQTPRKKKVTPVKTTWTKEDDKGLEKERINKKESPYSRKWNSLPESEKRKINGEVDGDKCGGKLKKHKFGGNILNLFKQGGSLNGTPFTRMVRQ